VKYNILSKKTIKHLSGRETNDLWPIRPRLSPNVAGLKTTRIHALFCVVKWPERFLKLINITKLITLQPVISVNNHQRL